MSVTRRVLFATLAVGTALLLLEYVSSEAQVLPHMQSAGDFGVFWRTSHIFANHGYELPAPASRDAVSTGDYAFYPPTFYLLFLPISSLPLATAAAVWLAFLQLCVLGTVALVYAGIGRPSPMEALAVGILVLAFIPLRVANADGQLSPVLAVLAAGALLAAHRRARVLGGGLLGLAIAIKLWPASLLAYFAWRRQWGVLAGAAGGVATLVLATLALGWGDRWSGYSTMLSARATSTTWAGDHSILASVTRIITGQTAAPRPGLVAVTIAVIVGGLLVLLTAATIHRVGTENPVSEWIGYGLALAVLPALLPFAWIHYWVLALVLIAAAARLGRLESLGRLPLILLSLAYTLLMLAPVVAFAADRASPSSLSALLWLDAAVPVACLAMTIALWSIAVRGRNDAPGAGSVGAGGRR